METLNDALRSFWDLETLGIKEPEQSMYEEFRDSIALKQHPMWRKQHPMLPDNYQLSLKRLYGLLRRLRQDPEILQEYNSIIQKQLHDRIVQKAENTEPMGSGRVHYLLHHAVVRQDKETAKLRIVYDASAKSDGP